MSLLRLRQIWLLALLVTGGMGAVVRFSNAFPDWFAKYGGDAVWAAAWLFAWLTVFPRMRPSRAGLSALSVCAGIELFQLTGIPAALAHKGFVFRLMLGTSFGAWDLAAYTLGVLTGAGVAAALPVHASARVGLCSD